MSCMNKKKADIPVTLLMAEANPAESIVGKMDLAFAEKVHELSNGSITVNLQCSSILGDETTVMKTIMTPESSIHLARVSASLANYGGIKSKLITIPYTFSNADHFWKFANSEIAEEILDEPYVANLGVKGLFYGEEGFRHFFSVSKLEKMEDMKGKKTRVSSSKVMQDLMNALQAIPVTVPFTDLYASLQTGNTDVADQPISNYYTNSFHTVAPYIILDGHMLGAVQVLINAKTWDSLSENQQKALKEAGKYASDYCRTIVNDIESETINKLIAEGATVVEVKDIKPWQAACAEMIKDSAKNAPDVYQKILDLAE
ncbi:MAG: TRAP transporter substrate-binding protein [Treponema sp.]|nr:TRAP transporter substrate-binding protein [Candidatus Treponema equifaecale]